MFCGPTPSSPSEHVSVFHSRHVLFFIPMSIHTPSSPSEHDGVADIVANDLITEQVFYIELVARRSPRQYQL